MRSPLILLSALSLPWLALASPPAEQVALQADGGVHTSEGWTYIDCGLPTDVVQIESIEVKPDPPKPGEDLTVTVKAKATETIEDGAFADVTVKLGLIKLLQKRFDMCQEALNANATLQCPVEPGSYIITQSVALPREIPRAKFTVSVRGFTAEEEDMLCLDLKVDFMKHPFLKLGW